MTPEQETLVFQMLTAYANAVADAIDRQRHNHDIPFIYCPACHQYMVQSNWKWGQYANEPTEITHRSDCILPLHSRLLETLSA